MKHLGSRQELAKWLYDIHNLVNDKLGVPVCERPSFEEIEERYESFRAACKPISEKEKNDKAGKGCIAPAAGKPKRSVIKVVEYEPTSPKPTALQEYPKSDDYIVISKKTISIISIFICIAIIILLIWMCKRKK
jgi:hypothetical protein